MLRATIPGDPKGQGSLALWRAPDGTERARHPPQTVLHRNLAVQVLRDAWGGREPLRDPVALTVLFRFARPHAHYGTGRNGGVLKASAPKWHTGYPDCDKGIRLINDALVVAGVIADDKQVCEIRASKIYAATGSTDVILEAFA